MRVVGSGDLRGVLDVEAVRQATGCDAAGCDAELADALGAPELVTAQIARVGDTWVFTLARLSRGDLGVRARAQRTADGDDPGLLLRLIPGLVRDIAPPEATPPEAPPDAALVVGAVGAGVGVVGAGLWGVSHLLHGEALRLVDRRDFAGAASSAATGRYVYWTGIATTSVGAAMLTAGAAAFLAARVTDVGGAP